MPIPAVIAAAASALLPLISDLLRSRGSKTSERNAEIIENVGPVLVEVARQVVPAAPNEQAAVEAVLADKAIQTQFRAAMVERWSDVAPFLEYDSKEREAARDFTVEMTGTGPLWRQVGWGALTAVLALLIVAGVGYTFWNVLFSEHTTFSQSTRDGIVELMKNVAILVVGFFFGTSASSKQKDQTISDQAKR